MPDLLASAHRPGETLGCHVVDAMVRRANATAVGPVTGRRLDATVCTGDSLDNKQANELRWYLTLLDGGDLAANSGASGVFEGVQGFDDPLSFDPHYYHPEPFAGLRRDDYKSGWCTGFPMSSCGSTATPTRTASSPARIRAGAAAATGT